MQHFQVPGIFFWLLSIHLIPQRRLRFQLRPCPSQSAMPWDIRCPWVKVNYGNFESNFQVWNFTTTKVISKVFNYFLFVLLYIELVYFCELIHNWMDQMAVHQVVGWSILAMPHWVRRLGQATQTAPALTFSTGRGRQVSAVPWLIENETL